MLINGHTTAILDAKVHLHTVTSLLGRNEDEAPITTPAPYANVNILTQSQNTYQEYHSTY